jgi:hypothetical protein
MCGAVAKRTEEHLLPRWLLDCIDPQLISGKAAWASLRVGGSADGVLPHDLISGGGGAGFQKSVKRVSARVVCRQCNGGWMAQIEDKLRWLQDFLLACRGLARHAQGTIHRGQFSAILPDRVQCAGLTRWSVMKAVTLALGWHDLGHLALDDDQLRCMRALRDGVRGDAMPAGLEIEIVQSFVPHVPLGCGLLLFGRSFVFTIKVQAFWLRVIMDHPEESRRLMRLAFLGPLLHPWGGTSQIATVARVEHFECRTGREESSLLTEGVVPSPEGCRWTDMQDTPMPMDTYRGFIPTIRDYLKVATTPKTRDASA